MKAKKGSKIDILSWLCIALGMVAMVIAHTMEHGSGVSTTLAAGGVLVTILSLAFEFTLGAAWFCYLLGVGMIALIFM